MFKMESLQRSFFIIRLTVSLVEQNLNLLFNLLQNIQKNRGDLIWKCGLIKDFQFLQIKSI